MHWIPKSWHLYTILITHQAEPYLTFVLCWRVIKHLISMTTTSHMILLVVSVVTWRRYYFIKNLHWMETQVESIGQTIQKHTINFSTQWGPHKNGCNLANALFRFIFLNQNCIILIQISSIFVPKGPTDVQQWFRYYWLGAEQAISHYLN